MKFTNLRKRLVDAIYPEGRGVSPDPKIYIKRSDADRQLLRIRKVTCPDCWLEIVDELLGRKIPDIEWPSDIPRPSTKEDAA